MSEGYEKDCKKLLVMEEELGSEAIVKARLRTKIVVNGQCPERASYKNTGGGPNAEAIATARWHP